MKKRVYTEFWVGDKTFYKYQEAFSFFMKNKKDEKYRCLFGLMDWGGFLPLVSVGRDGKLTGYFAKKAKGEKLY